MCFEVVTNKTIPVSNNLKLKFYPGGEWSIILYIGRKAVYLISLCPRQHCSRCENFLRNEQCVSARWCGKWKAPQNGRKHLLNIEFSGKIENYCLLLLLMLSCLCPSHSIRNNERFHFWRVVRTYVTVF